jgi:pyrroline-5-carboxylate reductase
LFLQQIKSQQPRTTQGGQSAMFKDKKIGFIGGGNMAEAIIRGLVAGGVPAAELTVADPVADRRDFLHERYGVAVTAQNNDVCVKCDVLILAVKPQICEAVLHGISDSVTPAKTLISIMAGIRTTTLEAALPTGTRVIRVMPNTPALVKAAASAISRGMHAGEDDISVARRIFELVGTTCLVDEKLLDAVTGLSGSGPAYVLTFIEALSDAGVKNGLPRETAFALAKQTVYGTAKLLLETCEHPAVLRDKVTSPGGTTIAALHSLENDRFPAAVINAVDAAIARSIELANK